MRNHKYPICKWWVFSLKNRDLIKVLPYVIQKTSAILTAPIPIVGNTKETLATVFLPDWSMLHQDHWLGNFGSLCWLEKRANKRLDSSAPHKKAKSKQVFSVCYPSTVSSKRNMFKAFEEHRCLCCLLFRNWTHLLTEYHRYWAPSVPCSLLFLSVIVLRVYYRRFINCFHGP